MLKVVIGTAFLLLGLAASAAAQPYRDGPGDGGASARRPVERPEGGERIGHRPGAAQGKPRVCFRPDIGRYSRLIPYSC